MAPKPDGRNSYSKPKTKKQDAKKPASSKPKGYDWGNGRAVHSIPLEQHLANKQGVDTYGLKPNTPLDAPLSAGQAYQMALAQAGQAYDPQINAVKTLQTSAPGWYQDYINRATQAQTAAQTYAQPMLQQAQAGVQNQQALTPGLDPSGPQAQQDQLAAQGRGALAQLGYDALAVVPVATNAYMGGQQATAARELPQVLAGYGQQVGQLQAQKGQAASEAYGTIRANEQNASIARQTLGLNTSKAAADVDLSRGVDPVTGKRLPAEPVKGYGPGTPDQNKYGYTYDEWSGLSEGQKAKARAGSGSGKTQEQKDAEKAAAAKDKQHKAVQKATGAIKSKVQNARDAWERYARARNPATKYDPDRGENVPDVDPKTGKQRTVKATPDQIKAQLRKDGYTEAEIHAMLVIRAGKQLTPSDIQRLKDQDPNFRVPAEWRQKKSKSPGGQRYGAVGRGADTIS